MAENFKDRYTLIEHSPKLLIIRVEVDILYLNRTIRHKSFT